MFKILVVWCDYDIDYQPVYAHTIYVTTHDICNRTRVSMLNEKRKLPHRQRSSKF
jgi:hypothetical protein